MSLRFQPASSADTADKGSLADEIKQLEEKQAQEDDAQAAVTRDKGLKTGTWLTIHPA
jgi:hypothetical protein